MRYQPSQREQLQKCLCAYIAALENGQAAAPSDPGGAYDKLLAAAAKFSRLIWEDPTSLRSTVRAEDRTFARNLLATDDGRAARTAFNRFARLAFELEEEVRQSPTAVDGPELEGPESLVGSRLYAITLILDYVQIHFDEGQFDVLGAIEVESGQDFRRSGQAGFWDILCGAIGQNVQAVALGETSIRICLDRHELHLSLRPEEWETAGPEAVVFSDQRGGCWVFDWADTVSSTDASSSLEARGDPSSST